MHIYKFWPLQHNCCNATLTERCANYFLSLIFDKPSSITAKLQVNFVFPAEDREVANCLEISISINKMGKVQYSGWNYLQLQICIIKRTPCKCMILLLPIQFKKSSCMKLHNFWSGELLVHLVSWNCYIKLNYQYRKQTSYFNYEEGNSRRLNIKGCLASQPIRTTFSSHVNERI